MVPIRSNQMVHRALWQNRSRKSLAYVSKQRNFQRSISYEVERIETAPRFDKVADIG